MPKTKDFTDTTTDLDYLITRTVEYYDGLRARGVPEQLAIRIVGDWYGSAIMLANTYFEGRYQQATSSLTRRIAQSMGET